MLEVKKDTGLILWFFLFASRSLFLAVDAIDDDEVVCEKIMSIAHTVKGVLLNMGQHEWADYVKDIEHAAKAGEDRDYKGMMQKLRRGMQEVCNISSVDLS